MSKQHIVKSIFWLTVAEIIFNLSGYIVHSGVGRILGPEEYGRYGLVVTLTTMVIILIGNGIPTAMSKFISEIYDSNPSLVSIIKRKAAFLQALVMGSVTVAFFLFSPLIAYALGDPSLIPLFRISSLIIPAFAAASFYAYYFNGIHRFNLHATLKTVRSFARIFFILVFALFFGLKGSVAGYIAAPFAVFLIALLLDRFWLSKKLPSNQSLDFDWKKLANYAWPMTLFLLFYEIMITIDLYMVKALLQSDHLTGIYNGALTLGRIPYYLFYALTIVLLPTISKATYEKNSKEAYKIISQSIRLLMIILVPVILLMALFSENIVELFYGARYVEAAGPMTIIAFGVGFLTLFYVMSFALNGAGKIKVPMWMAFFGALVNFFFNWILIQKFSIYGAAIATAITSLLMGGAVMIFVNKFFKATVHLQDTLKILLAASTVYLMYSALPYKENLFSILWAFPLLVSYFILIYFLRVISKKDISLLKKIK